LTGGWEIRPVQNPLKLIPEETRQEMLERGNYWKKTFESQEREANEVQPVSEER